MTIDLRSGLRSTRARALVAAGLLSAGAVWASPLAASATSSAAPQSTAVVTPLLTLFEFGDTVGVPEGCQTALTAVSAVVAQAALSNQFSPLAAQIGTECQHLADVGAGYIQQGLTASQSAAALNTLLNPGVAAGANALNTIGNSPGMQNSPLGPTIAGLSQTFTFFEGS
jgi:hypothetical protein